MCLCLWWLHTPQKMFAKTSLSVVRAATRRRALPTDTTKRFMSEYDNSPGKVRAVISTALGRPRSLRRLNKKGQ